MALGWIKLHRQFQEWEWFDSSDHVKVFIYLLLEATHKNHSWRGNKLKPGQFITSQKRVAEACKLTRQRVRTIFNDLKLTSELTIESTNRFSRITINKYSEYQKTDNAPTSQPTSQGAPKQPATNQPSNKNGKNGKKIGNATRPAIYCGRCQNGMIYTDGKHLLCECVKGGRNV